MFCTRVEPEEALPMQSPLRRSFVYSSVILSLGLILAACQLMPVPTGNPHPTGVDVLPVFNTKSDTSDAPEIVNFPNLVTSQRLTAIEQLATGKHFTLRFSTTSNEDPVHPQHIQVPLRGTYKLTVQPGNVFAIKDADGTDGAASVTLPQATYNAYLKLNGSRSVDQVRSLRIQDNLYYLKDELVRTKKGPGGFTVQGNKEPKLAKLQITAMCSNDPNNYRVWKITNPNTIDIAFRWSIEQTAQSAVGTAPPGESYLETDTEGGKNTIKLFVGVKQQDSQVSKPDVCLPGQEADWEESKWWSMGTRSLPVPVDWKSDNGTNQVFDLTNQGVTDFVIRWVKTPGQPASFPPGIKEIGPEGGTVDLMGVAKLEILPNSLPTKSTIILRQNLSAPLNIGYKDSGKLYIKDFYAGPVVSVFPEGLTFNKPAKLKITNFPGMLINACTDGLKWVMKDPSPLQTNWVWLNLNEQVIQTEQVGPADQETGNFSNDCDKSFDSYLLNISKTGIFSKLINQFYAPLSHEQEFAVDENFSIKSNSSPQFNIIKHTNGKFILFFRDIDFPLPAGSSLFMYDTHYPELRRLADYFNSVLDVYTQKFSSKTNYILPPSPWFHPRKDLLDRKYIQVLLDQTDSLNTDAVDQGQIQFIIPLDFKTNKDAGMKGINHEVWHSFQHAKTSLKDFDVFKKSSNPSKWLNESAADLAAFVVGLDVKSDYIKRISSTGATFPPAYPDLSAPTSGISDDINGQQLRLDIPLTDTLDGLSPYYATSYLNYLAKKYDPIDLLAKLAKHQLSQLHQHPDDYSTWAVDDTIAQTDGFISTFTDYTRAVYSKSDFYVQPDQNLKISGIDTLKNDSTISNPIIFQTQSLKCLSAQYYKVAGTQRETKVIVSVGNEPNVHYWLDFLDVDGKIIQGMSKLLDPGENKILPTPGHNVYTLLISMTNSDRNCPVSSTFNQSQARAQVFLDIPPPKFNKITPDKVVSSKDELMTVTGTGLTNIKSIVISNYNKVVRVEGTPTDNELQFRWPGNVGGILGGTFTFNGSENLCQIPGNCTISNEPHSLTVDVQPACSANEPPRIDDVTTHTRETALMGVEFTFCGEYPRSVGSAYRYFMVYTSGSHVDRIDTTSHTFAYVNRPSTYATDAHTPDYPEIYYDRLGNKVTGSGSVHLEAENRFNPSDIRISEEHNFLIDPQ